MPPKIHHFTDEQNARLRAIVKDELCSRIPRQLHLAPLLGIAQGNLSRFLDGKSGASAGLALRIAFLLNRSLEDILGVDGVPLLVDPQEERYPSRILAARACYLDGVPLTNIQAVLASSVRHDNGDPGARWWRKMMVEGHLAKPGSRRDTEWALKQVKVSLPKSRRGDGRPPKRR
jgi:hypothetical protein